MTLGFSTPSFGIETKYESGYTMEKSQVNTNKKEDGVSLLTDSFAYSTPDKIFCGQFKTLLDFDSTIIKKDWSIWNIEGQFTQTSKGSIIFSHEGKLYIAKITENNQTLNQLLVEMDGFDTTETIIVLAATNRPEMLDKALLRPGRFDRQVTIPAPDLIGREEILKLHSKNKKFAEDVDFKSIAGDTAGFTGAELANVLNEAAIIATRQKHSAITNMDIENAVKKITVGLEKTNRVVSDKDKKLTADGYVGVNTVKALLK